MSETSLGKSKIKILLLEGVHESAVEAFRGDGYTEIDYHPEIVGPAKLTRAVQDAHFIGIRRRPS